MFIAPEIAENIALGLRKIVPKIDLETQYIAPDALIPYMDKQIVKDMPQAQKPFFPATTPLEAEKCNEEHLIDYLI